MENKILEELYVYHPHKLPYGGREYNLLNELLETGTITHEDIVRLLELTPEHINALMKSKFHRGSKFSSEGSNPPKVKVLFIEKKIRMFDENTGADLTDGFQAIQERIVLSLSLIHAIRIVGNDACRRVHFVYDRVELFDSVEYLDHQDLKGFLDLQGAVEYTSQENNT